jgi:hypothetical protein
MEKEKLEFYADYLISNNAYATATGLLALLDGKMSHNKVTRFLSARNIRRTMYDERSNRQFAKLKARMGMACLIFANTIQEKTWTDENDVMRWYYEHRT